MAAAGMGDALTGLVAGLVRRAPRHLDALLAGVWLHGAAGDSVARTNAGPLGVTASELIDRARTLLNRSINPASSECRRKTDLRRPDEGEYEGKHPRTSSACLAN